MPSQSGKFVPAAEQHRRSQEEGEKMLREESFEPGSRRGYPDVLTGGPFNQCP